MTGIFEKSCRLRLVKANKVGAPWTVLAQLALGSAGRSRQAALCPGADVFMRLGEKHLFPGLDAGFG
jgi:hypothetical protein